MTEYTYVISCFFTIKVQSGGKVNILLTLLAHYFEFSYSYFYRNSAGILPCLKNNFHSIDNELVVTSQDSRFGDLRESSLFGVAQKSIIAFGRLSSDTRCVPTSNCGRRSYSCGLYIIEYRIISIHAKGFLTIKINLSILRATILIWLCLLLKPQNLLYT